MKDKVLLLIGAGKGPSVGVRCEGTLKVEVKNHCGKKPVRVYNGEVEPFLSVMEDGEYLCEVGKEMMKVRAEYDGASTQMICFVRM